MNRSCLPIQLASLVLLLCVGVGCGSSSIPAPPVVSISATKHPLVAQYSLTSTCKGQARVDFGLDTTYGRSTAWYATPGAAGGATVNILVAGMKASTTYHLRSEFQCENNQWVSPDQTFKTGPLPSNPWPTLTVARPNPSLTPKEGPGVELIDVLDTTGKTGMMQALVTDRDAHPIWYYDVGVKQGRWPYVYKLLPNGHMIFVIATTNQVTGGPILREVDLAGNTIRELDTNVLDQRMQQAGFNFQLAFYHHDVLPLANGHLIVLGNYYKNYTNLPGYPGTVPVVGDALVDLDADWNPVWAWSTFDHLDINRHLNGLPDWTHGNAIVYSAADGNLLLSLRHQSWVLKIDYQNGAGTGDVLWKLGYQGDFSLPSDDPSQWFSFQHYPWILSQNGSETTLAVWDNGDATVLDSKGDLCIAFPQGYPNSCDSHARIYKVDESTKAATLAWQYATGLFSEWGGSINQFANGNVEFDINAPLLQSFASQVQEITSTTSPQIVWQMTINPLNAYRAYRIASLYPGVSWEN
jgi:arylsulfate sulfotransferase